jgi:hypothetical protein
MALLQDDTGERPLKGRLDKAVRRRDLLGLVVLGAGAAAANVVIPETAAARTDDLKDKRRARYQANSGEVRNFYRVNSYPAR